jgi:hypothetical protein
MRPIRIRVAIFAALAAALMLGCVSHDHGRRDRYDDRYPRNDPYYGGRYPVPYGHPDYDHDSRLERHQKRERRALEHEQQSEDRSLKREQKQERREQRQEGEWSQEDKKRQREERKEQERDQQGDRQDLRRHQKEERRGYWD